MTSPLARTTAVACAATLGAAALVADVVTLPTPTPEPVPTAVQTIALTGVATTELDEASAAVTEAVDQRAVGHVQHRLDEQADHRAERERPDDGPLADSARRGMHRRGLSPEPAVEATGSPTDPDDGAAASPAPAVPSASPVPAVPSLPPTPAVPSTPAAASDGPEILTEELDTQDFTLVGVTWEEDDAPEDVAVRVRVREPGGWSEWQLLDVSDEGPDAGTEEHEAAERVSATVPLVTDDADGLQVRIDTVDGEVPEDVEAVLVDPGESPADETLGTSTPLTTADALLAAPSIVTRAQWGADESKRNCGPYYSETIEAATVHHTAGTNSYSSSDSAAIVRGVYAYHTDGLGWCDVGYNFLVDRFGRVFEGRYGGRTAAVRGAHAGGFNADTVGVAAMGNFVSAKAPAEMVRSIGQVIGWKLGLYGRSVYGTTSLTSAGGGTARYSEGTTVTLERVMGHRDVGATSCPGGDLHANLPAVRSAGASYQESAKLPPDLGVIATSSRGRVDIHTQGRGSAYRNRALAKVTGMSEQDAGQWRFFLGPATSGGAPDLIAVQIAGTSSGKVEVEVWSYASNYQKKTLDVVTPMHTVSTGGRWHLTTRPSSQGQTDLVFVTTRGASGYTEIHSLSAHRDYRSFNLHRRTGLKRSFTGDDVQFLLDAESNFYWILYKDTGSGRTEVHTLSAASRHQRHILHKATLLHEVSGDQWRFTIGDYDGRGGQDLHAVRIAGRSRVEVHVLAHRTGYKSWLLHRATDLPELGTFPSWQVDMTS